MNLRPYQSATSDKLVKQGHGGIFYEMGLGKTATMLDVIRRIRPKRTLVVAPKMVALATWPAEVARWTPDLSINVAVGTKAQVTKAVSKRSDIVVTNFQRMVLFHKEGWFEQFDCIVVDESSRIKSLSAMWTKVILKQADTTEHRFILSGTPTPNGKLEELWAQMRFADRGKRLGRTKTAFHANYCECHLRHLGPRVIREWGVRADMAEEINRLAKEICVAARSSDHLHLPNQTIEHTLPLTKSLRGRYETLRDEAVLELEGIEAQDIPFMSGVMVGRLAQFTSGAVYSTDKGERTTNEIHSIKLDALKEIIESTGSNLLIGYNFNFEKEWLAKLGAEFVNPSTIDAWNAGRIPLLAVHPKSAGHGINLQQGGHHLVWLSLPWSFEDYAQTNARLIRSGQTNTVFIHHLIIEETVDGRILSQLGVKKNGNDNLLDYLKQCS